MIIIKIIIACSRRSDRGDSAKRCGVRERERESLYFSLFSSLFYFSLSSFAPHSTVQTPGTGYDNNNEYDNDNDNDTHIIIILCDNDDGDDDDDDKYLFSLESLIFL